MPFDLDPRTERSTRREGHKKHHKALPDEIAVVDPKDVSEAFAEDKPKPRKKAVKKTTKKRAKKATS